MRRRDFITLLGGALAAFGSTIPAATSRARSLDRVAADSQVESTLSYALLMSGSAANRLFISRECDWVHHLARSPLSKVRHSDIDLAPRGERWHRNQTSLLPSG